ncbi:cytochrome c3 family protein [Parvicella tangerina]|uniref:cytochrome c3 family protein n=1 Tax=Parvicella tangerina TaxID=2829795 RepID=UPI00215C8D47|nr:cytochrome c3 family protein [Parvicella tangerina]
MKKLGIICLLSMVFALFANPLSAQEDAGKGKELFKANCASCHKIDKPSTGPALQGAKQRWADAGEAELIYEWVQNNAALRGSGKSKRAEAVYKEWKEAAMTNFTALSKEDIDNILYYADTYVKDDGGGQDVVQVEGEDQKKGGVKVWLLILGIVLLFVVFAALGVRKKLAYIAAAEKGEDLGEEKTTMEKLGAWIYANWLFALLIFVVVVFAGLADILTRLATIGVYEDYQPSQVVAYDHSLHAGTMEIDCRYCHNSVEKSKHAGLPTTNVCMNCHANVWVSKKGTGENEIAKLHKAAGFDKELKGYIKDENGDVVEGDPIVWNKAHNLPDHVFFSHKQHVKVGGIDCMQCHGDVKTYTLGRVSTTAEINALIADNSDLGLVELTKPILTMGWCIECHDKKEIEVGPDASNPYYQEIHNRLKLRPDVYKNIKEDGVITVKELGGWECAKCHY